MGKGSHYRKSTKQGCQRLQIKVTEIMCIRWNEDTGDYHGNQSNAKDGLFLYEDGGRSKQVLV